MIVRAEKIRNLKTAWLESVPEGYGLTDGNEPILFFIHGFPDSPETWKPQFDYFSKRFHIVAPYLRGLSPNEIPRDRKRFSTRSITLDHLEILRHVDPLGKRPVCVIGHDIGAPYAWELARILKERLKSLIVIDGPSIDQMFRRISNLRQLRKSWYIGLFQLPWLPEFIIRNWGSSIGISTKTIRCLDHYRCIAREGVRHILKKVPPLSKPVLVLWGKDDRYLEIPTPRELKKLASNHTLRVLEAGHWVNREKAQQVNRLMEEFLVN